MFKSYQGQIPWRRNKPTCQLSPSQIFLQKIMQVSFSLPFYGHSSIAAL